MAMRTRRSRRLPAADRRRQILEVTRELVAEQGFHALSMEAVSQRAGITRPVVYEHFGDLGGLLEALVDEMGERALGQLAAILAPDGDPATGASSCWRRFAVTWRRPGPTPIPGG